MNWECFIYVILASCQIHKSEWVNSSIEQNKPSNEDPSKMSQFNSNTQSHFWKTYKIKNLSLQFSRLLFKNKC